MASHCAFSGLPSPHASVAQNHGSTCGPAKIGPPIGWFVIASRARRRPSRATSVLRPTRRPRISPV